MIIYNESIEVFTASKKKMLEAMGDAQSIVFYSQIGRLQFAALQPVAPDENGESPHVKIDGHWRFMEDRLGESHQSLCDYGKDYPELKPFDPVELVKDFMDFVVKREA